MNPWLILAALGAAASGGGWLSYELTSGHYERVIVADKAIADKQVADANQRAQNAADDYEVWQSIQKPKVVTRIREVEREVKADTDCSARPLPAGLRDTLTQSARDNQPVAYSPLPAASATGFGLVGVAGTGLRGSAGGTGRLLSAPQSAR